MRVIDLLSIISEHAEVGIETGIPDGYRLAYYNGRDSIPEELNDREVIEISAGIGNITITITEG